MCGCVIASEYLSELILKPYKKHYLFCYSYLLLTWFAECLEESIYFEIKKNSMTDEYHIGDPISTDAILNCLPTPNPLTSTSDPVAGVNSSSATPIAIPGRAFSRTARLQEQRPHDPLTPPDISATNSTWNPLESANQHKRAAAKSLFSHQSTFVSLRGFTPRPTHLTPHYILNPDQHT